MTPTCPSADDLRAFLDDRLAADSEVGVLDHVDVCPHCQRALEALTDGDLPSAMLLARSTRAEYLETTQAAKVTHGLDRARPERIGPYRVSRELGRGGMGVVYLATHTKLLREAAVKLIRAGASARPEDVARFRREAKAVAAVAHPNVVAVYETGEQDSVPWLALEYVSGGSLREYLGGRPLPARAAAEIARGLARGAAAVHSAGVIHRDIKPANVLLAPTSDGGSVVPKLTDFGLAKDLAGAGVTMSGMVLGTPHYMAPEQARTGEPVGPTADVYAIGAVLYEALTGSPPFNGSDPVAVLQLVTTREPVPVGELQPAVPRDLQTICHKCLEKDPARRYPTAEALADDLGRFLDGRPITARPVGVAESAWRRARRNPVLSALAGALVVAVVAGVGGVTWKWREAAAERDKTAAAERNTATERDAAVAARTAARRQTALALLDKGVAAAEAGRVGEGLVWMTEALAVAPPEDADLDRVVRMNIAGWLPHAARVRSVSPLPQDGVPINLTPDGRSLVIRTANGRFRLQPLEPGVGPAVEGELNPHYGDAVSADGRFILDVANPPGEPQALTGWDIAARRATGPAYRPGSPLTQVVPAPTGTTAAVTLADGRLILFDLAASRPVADPLRHPHPDDLVTALAYAPDGKVLYTWTDSLLTGPAAHAWDTATGARSESRYGGQAVRRAAFSPRGDRLVTVSADGTARLWDVSAGTTVGLPLASSGQVVQLAFSPDGRYAVLLAGIGAARWWDTARGELVAPPTAGPITWFGFRSGGTSLVTVGAVDPSVVVWDLPRAQARPARLPVQRADRRPTREDPQTATDTRPAVAVTAGLQVPPRVWDIAAGRPGPVPLRLLGRKVYAVASSPDGRRLAASVITDDPAASEVYVWDAATGRPTARIPHVNWVRGMAFTPDGGILVTGGFDRVVHTWDAATGRRLGSPTPVRRMIVFGLKVSPDGRSLAVSRSAGALAIGPAVLDLGTDSSAPAVRESWATAEAPEVEEIRFTRDGRYVFGYSSSDIHAFGFQRPVSRRDARTGELAGPPIPVYRLRTATVADDGRTVLVGAGDGIARCWDLETGEPAGPPLAHPSAINACELFLPRDLALCGCDDGSARVWDLRTGRPVGPPLTHGPPLTAVAFGPDGRSVRTAAIDGSVRTWEIPEPTPGDPELVRQAVAYRTTLALDPGQRVVPLTAALWTATPPADVSDGSLSHPEWLAARARDAEADGAWSVAAYYLDQLLAAPAGDRAELFARRGRCESAAGRFERAAGWYSRAEAVGSADRLADWYVNRAIESGIADHWATASWYVERVAAVRPGDEDVLVARAEARDRLKDVDGWAEVVARDFTDAQPADLVRWANRAAAHGRWAFAADLFERSPAPRPGELYRAAVARLKAGDPAGYARICKRLEAELRDDTPATWLNNAAWLLSLAPGGAADPDRLARLLTAILEATTDPGEKHAYAKTLGAVLIRAGRYDDAVRCIERGIAVGGETSPEDTVLLAIAHGKLGDGTRAAARLAEAREAATRKKYLDRPWPARVPLELLLAEAAVGGSPKNQAPPPKPKAPASSIR